MPVTHKLFPVPKDATGFREHINDICKLYEVLAVFDHDSYKDERGDFQEVLRIKVLPGEKQKGGKHGRGKV